MKIFQITMWIDNYNHVSGYEIIINKVKRVIFDKETIDKINELIKPYYENI